jgi:hypothetical protein
MPSLFKSLHGGSELTDRPEGLCKLIEPAQRERAALGEAVERAVWRRGSAGAPSRQRRPKCCWTPFAGSVR